ncbi:optic atrophy 3 protein (OPA3) [Carex rostrata]
MVLPVLKLGTLALKTLCKPIAYRLKKEAGKHPKFRELIIRLAQANHRTSTNLQRRIYGHSLNVEIRPLNEEKAVQAASDLIGELFVFSVAGAALIFEVQRNARSEARKEELRKMELQALKQKEEELAREVDLLKQKLDEIENLAKARGLSGVFNLRGNRKIESAPSATPAS